MRKKAILITCLAFLPCVASANAGTSLMWATAFHMLLGNAFLGIFEGALLARVFKLPDVRCISSMVVANYFSAWLGAFLIQGLRASWTVDIYNGLQVSLALIFITYLLTLILEWPFIAFSFWRTQNWIRRSIKATLLIQTLSYLLLFGWYWSASGKTLYTDTTIVPAAEVSFPEGVQLFYISNVDGNVYRKSRLGGETKIYDLKSSNARDYLCISESERGGDLVAVLPGEHNQDAEVMVLPDILKTKDNAYWEVNHYRSYGDASKVGAAIDSPWQIGWDQYDTVGITGENEKSGENFRVSYGTPVMGWSVYRAIHLPEEKVLFQLGMDQLCLFDIATRKLAIFARGHGPVALTDEEMADHSSNSKTD